MALVLLISFHREREEPPVPLKVPRGGQVHGHPRPGSMGHGLVTADLCKLKILERADWMSFLASSIFFVCFSFRFS